MTLHESLYLTRCKLNNDKKFRIKNKLFKYILILELEGNNYEDIVAGGDEEAPSVQDMTVTTGMQLPHRWIRSTHVDTMHVVSY